MNILKIFNHAISKLILTFALVVSLVIPYIPNAQAESKLEGSILADDLFFSEYIEGSSNNKALEIYNGTGANVNLDGYVVELYSNGNASAQSVENLSGTLGSGDVYVLYHTSAVQGLKALGDKVSGTTNFNGDDTVLLKKNGEIIDSFGQIGFQPSTSWTVNGVSTINQTLVRKSSITTGDKDASNAFDPSVEWDSHPIDTFTFLGSHVMEGGEGTPPPAETKVANVTATPGAGAVVTGTQVTLATTTKDATIYYTVDGSDPSDSNQATQVYTMPIEINGATTIKAIAKKDGLETSAIQMYSYTLIQSQTVAEVRAATLKSSVVTEAIVTTDIAKFGNNGFYIQDATAGIYVYTTTDTGVKQGDRIQIQGTLDAFQNELQITPVTPDTPAPVYGE